MNFEPDDDALVWARSPDAAREFLGTPPHWPVRVIERRPDGATLYAVQAEGLCDVPSN